MTILDDRKSPPSTGRTFFAALGFFLGLLAFSPLASTPRAQEAGGLLLPMEGHVEKEKLPIALYARIPFETYGEEPVALDDFLERRPGDPLEAAFQDLMRGLADNDAEAAGPFITSEESEAALEHRREKVALWHKAFGGFDDAEILGRLAYDDMTLFFWQVPGRGGAPFLRSFNVRPRPGGHTGTLTSSAWPLTAALVDALPYRDRAPATLPERVNLALPVSFKLGGEPVPLLFEAYAPQFELFSDPLPQTYQPLRFYAQTWRHLLAGRYDEFAASYTEGSEKKIRRQLESQRQAFLDIATQPRTVWLVVHADPLYFVFYTAGEGRLAEKSLVRFDSMWRDDDGNFHMTNYLYEQDLDRVLRDATQLHLNEFLGKLRPL